MMGWMKKEISPQKKLEESKLVAKELIKASMELPHQTNQALGRLNKGEIKIDFAHMNLETLIEKIESHGNDLYYGIIVATLLLGSFYVIGSTRGPQIYDMSAVGLAGFAVAAMMVATRMIKK